MSAALRNLLLGVAGLGLALVLAAPLALDGGTLAVAWWVLALLLALVAGAHLLLGQSARRAAAKEPQPLVARPGQPLDFDQPWRGGNP